MPRKKQPIKIKKPQTEVSLKFSLDYLADELLLQIFSYLSFFDVMSLALTNKHLNALSKDEVLWSLLIAKHFSYAQKELLEKVNRRDAFRTQFTTAFDKRFFPGLQNKHQILNAFQGEILNIITSEEDRHTIGALLATAIANQRSQDVTSEPTSSLRLNPSDIGLALICAARNGNTALIDQTSHMLKSGFANIPNINCKLDLDHIIARAIIHSGNHQAIFDIFEKSDLSLACHMMKAQLMHTGGDDSDELFNRLTERFPRARAALVTQNFFVQEAARENKFIQFSTFSALGFLPVEAYKVMPLPSSSRKEITYDAEMQRGYNISWEKRKSLAKLAIREGYIELLKKILLIDYAVEKEDFKSLGISYPKQSNHVMYYVKEAFFMQAMMDKALMLAVKKNDKKTATRLLQQYTISPLILGKSFIYAVAKSYLDLLPILLGKEGHEVGKSFFEQALELAGDDVKTYLAAHYSHLIPFELLRQKRGFFSAIISKINDHFSHRPSSEKAVSLASAPRIRALTKFFDKVMHMDPPREDLSNPSQLVLAFQRYTTDHKLPPSQIEGRFLPCEPRNILKNHLSKPG